MKILICSVVMWLCRVLNDARLTVVGLFAIGRHFFSKDDNLLSISLFSSNSTMAREGEFSKYEVILANNTAQHRWIKLHIDINLKDNSTRPNGIYAYFEKKIFVRSRENQRIEVAYDWRNSVTFTIDGLILSPDTMLCGSWQTRGACLVKAVLFADEGKPYEELTLIQQLSS